MKTENEIREILEDTRCSLCQKKLVTGVFKTVQVLKEDRRLSSIFFCTEEHAMMFMESAKLRFRWFDAEDRFKQIKFSRRTI